MNKLGYITLAAGLLLATASSAFATVTPVPEISPSSVSAGLALLTSGALLVRAWRK